MTIRSAMKWIGLLVMPAFAAGMTAIAAGGILPLTVTKAMADDCKAHAVDLGEGKSVNIGCGDLKIAFINGCTNNVYCQAQVKGAYDAAKEAGVKLVMFDGNWNATTQYNQVQNVLSGTDFNAIYGGMVDGAQACSILTNDAPAKNFLVAVANQPLCNRVLKEGDEFWAPGTLTFVGGSQSRTAFREWLTGIAEANPGPQKIAVLTGPEGNANTINTDAAVQDVMAKYPDFKVVATVRTDYTVLGGNQKTVPLLQANPDLTMIIANYSDITRGTVQAVAQAGRAGSIKIYDNGGNEWAFQAVKDGSIASTRMLTPYTESVKTVQALVAAWKGDAVPRFIGLESGVVTKDNLDQFKPEY